MRTLIVGDIHGCSRELELLLNLSEPDRIVAVGDLFTKGPDPAGVWKLIEERNIESVLGNHDDRLLKWIRGKREDPAAKAVVKKLDATGPKWRTWLASLPLFLHLDECTVIHAGVHPKKRPEDTPRKVLLNVRRWPDDHADHPFWWERYRGKRFLVYGHDARRGLVKTKRTLGLDTGCVYGGSLTGFVLPSRDILSIPAARTYLDPLKRK